MATILEALRNKVRVDFLPRWLRLWGPALIGIPGMLALGLWGGQAARFLLFTHHLFYLLAGILLLNPVAETFWPTKPKRKQKRRRTRE